MTIPISPIPLPRIRSASRGVFSADILAPDACDTLAFWMEKGLTGLRLFTTGSTMPGQADWLDDPRSFPAWKFAGEHRLPVCLQMTAKGNSATWPEFWIAFPNFA